jgi:hypothetical protein
MEDFEKAVAMLKRDELRESDWKFLALVISSMMWSAECHEHLIHAVNVYERDAGL